MHDHSCDVWWGCWTGPYPSCPVHALRQIVKRTGNPCAWSPQIVKRVTIMGNTCAWSRCWAQIVKSINNGHLVQHQSHYLTSHAMDRSKLGKGWLRSFVSTINIWVPLQREVASKCYRYMFAVHTFCVPNSTQKQKCMARMQRPGGVHLSRIIFQVHVDEQLLHRGRRDANYNNHNHEQQLPA